MNQSATGTSKGKFWTIRYAIICATYFAAFCGVHAYASVFLLSKGFSNRQIGLVLAFANISSVIIQPIIAGQIDKKGKLTNRNASAIATMLMIFFSCLLFVVRNNNIVIFVVYILIYMVQMVYQPLIIAMNFEYNGKGAAINFGLARGIGSAGFAVFSTIMGNVLVHADIYALQIADILVLLCGLLFLLTFTLPENKEVNPGKNKIKHAGMDDGAVYEEKVPQTESVAHNNFFEFAKHYPKFIVLLIAIICFFFVHNMCNDYLIQIITPIGGTQRELGYAVSIAAIVELPTMGLFGRLTKKIDCGKLLKLSSVFFFVKSAILLCSTSMAGVYISQICQIFAYALFVPASAYYVNKVMEELDQVKGQAYINCGITIGGVFSSLICGSVLDLYGTKVMMLIGIIVCLAGTITALIITQNVNHLVNGKVPVSAEQ